MTRRIDIGSLSCLCSTDGGTRRIAYILYPADTLGDWIEAASARYRTAIVVVTGIDWQDALTPWPAAGVPKGSPDFKGDAQSFLSTLQTQLIPEVERQLSIPVGTERTLVGVSLSGLFALWQWLLCDTFQSIASLSGSFWYDGFARWALAQPVDGKRGSAFFLLGQKESRSAVKAFDSVGADTQAIVDYLKRSGVPTTFEMVAGNHYTDPIGRLNLAFGSLFATKKQ